MVHLLSSKTSSIESLKASRPGYEAFFVGGTVRDLCTNKTPKDIDIVTSAELHEVRALVA